VVRRPPGRGDHQVDDVEVDGRGVVQVGLGGCLVKRADQRSVRAQDGGCRAPGDPEARDEHAPAVEAGRSGSSH